MYLLYMISKDEIKFKEEILKMSKQLKKHHPDMIEITQEYLDEIPSKTLHDIAENIHLSIKGYTSQKAGKKTRKHRGKKKKKNDTKNARWSVGCIFSRSSGYSRSIYCSW